MKMDCAQCSMHLCIYTSVNNLCVRFQCCVVKTQKLETNFAVYHRVTVLTDRWVVGYYCLVLLLLYKDVQRR